jgi:hypothetical protein
MKRFIALSLVSLLVILLSACGSTDSITCSKCNEALPKNSLFCSQCGNAVNSTQPSEADNPKEITREALIAKLGGVLNVSCEEIIKYRDLLEKSEYYIEGKIEKAEYDTFYKTYEYELDAGLFDTVTVHNTLIFNEGDYVYVTVKGLGTYHGVSDRIEISKSKANEEYLSAEEYFKICKANEKTRFKVTGYILDSYIDIYGDTIYYMYESEEDYTGEKYWDKCILIEFSDKQTNIMGKKIQVMGSLWGDGLHNCSIVSD